MVSTPTPPKYRSLTALLHCLNDAMRRGDMRLAEGWRDDEQALGLELPEEPRLSAFVYTYGQKPGHFGVELWFPEPALASIAGVPLTQEGLDMAHLIAILGTHFDLRVSA